MERLLFECAVRSTLIAAAAAAVLSGMRIKNVVARHSAWTSVLVFMLALPMWMAFGHPVPLKVLPPVRQNVEQVAASSSEKGPFILTEIPQSLPDSSRGGTEPRRFAWLRWIEGIYILGVAMLLLRLITGMIGASRVRRNARLVDGRLTSVSCSSPITVGWVHSVTLLPEGWQGWELAKLDAVLIHEQEHERRHDPLVQWLALVNRAIFWFHPLAWWLERRLAAMSEQACDLAVLERGHSAGDYSRYLLELARSVGDSHRRIRLLGMTMPGAYLPQRIHKMLSGGQAPKVSFLRMASATAVFFLLSVGLSSATPVRAQSSKATAIGAEIVVQPPGSGAIPVIKDNSMPLVIGDKLRELPGVIQQAQTPPQTGRPLIFEAAAVRPLASPAVKVEQGNDQSKRVPEQPSDEALLLQRAKDLGFNGDIEVLKTMERMRQDGNFPSMETLEKDIVSRGWNLDEVKQRIRVQYLRTRVLESEVYGQVAAPTNDDIHKYYDAHLQDFNRPAGVHVREITILTGNREPEQIESQRKKAEAALSAVNKGDDFREVAAKYSESQTAQEGGDLGFFAKGLLSPQLEEVADKLDKGEVSEIIPVQGAFMIIKVDDKHLGGILPFELAQKEIRDILWREAVQLKIREYLNKLRTSGR